jgi:hypothetical protein
MGNIDGYTELVSGKPYEGVALRLFDAKTKLWSIYWADSNSGALDPQSGVIREQNRARSRHIRDRTSSWSSDGTRNPQRPIWSQAFSTDEGKTWEWNSINVSERIK